MSAEPLAGVVLKQPKEVSTSPVFVQAVASVA
jgi:hypothetical protein